MRSAASAGVCVEWELSWSPAVAQAFAALPPDHLMDPELVRRLWEDGVGRDRQKIALIRSLSGEPVGVVPLRKRGRASWELLTHYVMPYSRFLVRPEYTDAALHVLGREIDCYRVVFTRVPSRTRMLRPEESWVTPLETTYAALMARTKYGAKDRKFRRETVAFDLREDDYAALPEALDCWQAKWLAAGSPGTAGRKGDLLLGFGVLAAQGRLKTFSLHDGDKLAAMGIAMIGPRTLYAITKVLKDEYRQAHAGIRVMLAALEWGCAQGLAEYDMLPNFGHYKQRLAQPHVRGYRVVRRPFGSEALGGAVEGTKEFLWNLRHKDGHADGP